MSPCSLVSIKVTLTKVELLLYTTYCHTSKDSTHVYTHTYTWTCMCEFILWHKEQLLPKYINPINYLIWKSEFGYLNVFPILPSSLSMCYIQSSLFKENDTSGENRTISQSLLCTYKLHTRASVIDSGAKWQNITEREQVECKNTRNLFDTLLTWS